MPNVINTELEYPLVTPNAASAIPAIVASFSILIGILNFLLRFLPKGTLDQ